MVLKHATLRAREKFYKQLELASTSIERQNVFPDLPSSMASNYTQPKPTEPSSNQPKPTYPSSNKPKPTVTYFNQSKPANSSSNQQNPTTASTQATSPEKSHVQSKPQERSHPKPKPTGSTERAQDYSLLDIRVGKIVHAIANPMHKHLFLENIDLGVPGETWLAANDMEGHYTLDQLQGKMVVVLCNVKPQGTRGLSYRALLLCAKTPEKLRGIILPPNPNAASTEKIELLSPPPGALQGDVVTVQGYPYNPQPFLDQQTDIFYDVANDLTINSFKQAVYKGVPLRVEGKGFITSNTMVDCPVNFE